MAKDAKAEADTTDAAPTKKKSKKLLIIVVILLVVLLILGGGVAFLIMKKNSANAQAEGAAAPQHAAVAEKAGPPVYAALDTFTVNLVGDQFLQLVLSVEVKDIHVDEELKTYSPKLRNNIMLLLSGKQAAELMTKEGKEKLANEIRDLMNAVLEPGAKPGEKPGEGPVKEVLFTSFIIQ